MLQFLVALEVSIGYAIPVKPLPYYRYAVEFSMQRGYFSGSYFRVGSRGTGSYYLYIISAGMQYRIKFLAISSGISLITRGRNEFRESALNPFVSFNAHIGNEYRAFAGMRVFPGRERILSFMVVGFSIMR